MSAGTETMERRPNILLIITDSQGKNVLGESGAGYISTPRIDRLAREGLQFHRAYNACPLCTPARAGLFTGTYPHSAGAWGNDIPLGTTARTMGHFFERAGYRSAYIGKWHLDGTDYFGSGIAPGGWLPEYWYDGRNYLEDLPKKERPLWRTGLKSAEHIDLHGITRDWTWAGQITNRAKEFLRTWDRSAPYLMVVSYDEPHDPSVCPAPFNRMYENFRYPLPTNHDYDRTKKPAHHREWAAEFQFDPRGMNQSLYFGAGSFVDDEIGHVLDMADQVDPENTVIVFTTDHGHYLGSHHLQGKGPCLYEEVINVPLIFRGKNIPTGESSSSLISHVDLLPTLLAQTGIDRPAIFDGVDQSPVLQNPEKSVRDDLLCEFHRFSVTHDSWFGFTPVRSLISNGFKLTINFNYNDELYDLERDPGETDNLIAHPDYAETREALHESLLLQMDSGRDPFRGPLWRRRPWSVHASEREVPGLGGMRRPRPDDSFMPEVYHYDTGLKPGESA